MKLWRRSASLAFVFSCVICASEVTTSGPFEFHSNPWLNLHHFLYEQTLHQGPFPGEFTAAEKGAWLKALEFYRRSMISRDLLFDLRMRSIDTKLAEEENLPKLMANGADGALWETLNEVAPIYRVHWWPGHDRLNRSWIAAAVPLLQRYSGIIIRQMAAAYETSWPRGPIRVDVSEYANWAGAYTYTSGRNNIHEIVSSANPAYRGAAALEMLFHEASHGVAGGKLAEETARAAKRSGMRPPKDLAHVLIFYTAGELTRRTVASDYLPYADKKGLYKDDWARWHRGVQVYWKRHLDGSLSLRDAISKIVKSHTQ